MGTTAQKLNRVLETKSDLKTVINYSGANITNETTFKEYPKLLNKAYIDILNDEGESLYNALPKTTETGSNLTLNTEEGKMKITLKGDTQQEGTPTPSNPQNVEVVTGGQTVKIVGKNLFDKDNHVIDRAYLPMDINNTQIKSISETATFTSKILIIKLEEGKTYTIQKISSARFRFGFTNTSTPAKDTNNVITSRLPNADTSSKVTFTVPNGSPYFVCNFFSDDQSADAQKGYDAIVDTVQIEDGSQATEYVEYQEQNYPINLGKNLFDKNNMSVLNGYLWQNQMVLKDTYTDRIFYIPCQPNSTYTISRSILTKNFRVATYNDVIPTVTSEKIDYTCYNEINNNNGTTITITTDSNSKYLLVMYANVNNDTNINESLASIQIEKGSQATEYAPYFEPIELCKIGDYADQLFKNTTDSEFYDSTLLENEWYLKKNITKHVFEGDDSIDDYAYSTDLANVLAINLLPNKVDQGVIKPKNIYALYSDEFTYINNTNNIEHIYISQPTTTPTGWIGNIRLYINHARLNGYSSSLTNVQKRDLLLNWLSVNPLTVYFIARYPVAIHISETDYPTLHQQLENIYNNVKSYEGDTHITQTNDDLPFNLEVSALAKIE